MSEQPEIRSERPSVTSEQSQGRSQESWVVSGPQVIDVDEVRSLRVQLVGGRVDVVVHDEPGARIEVHSVDGRPLEVSLIDGELRVGYSFTLGGWEGFLEKFLNFRDKDRADVSIAVPRDLPTKVGTVSADGLLAGVEAQASVSTVSGSLVVDGTRGRLSANTVSGEVVVRDHSGDLTLNTVSGDLAASGALDPGPGELGLRRARARRHLGHVVDRGHVPCRATSPCGSPGARACTCRPTP